MPATLAPSRTVVARCRQPSYIATPLSGITDALSGTDTQVVFDNGTDIGGAAAAAAADYAVVFVGTLSHEVATGASLSLDDGCDPSSPETDNIGYQCRATMRSRMRSSRPSPRQTRRPLSSLLFRVQY